MEIPVVFILYNRPEKTRRSFAAIRAVKPVVLYLVADGARDEADEQRVAEARRVAEAVDWPCRVRLIYADHNLGCGPRIASGLDEVFRECDKAIVVEDDIVAAPEFFAFCREMLLRYEADERMMAVTGWNGLVEHQSDSCRAFVSKHMSVWGWATWRRAWALNRFNPTWPTEWVEERLGGYFADPFHRKLQQHIYAQRLWERYQTWDFQWGLSIYVNHGLVITPTVNLCQNIGFDAEGTHLTAGNLRGGFPTLGEKFADSPPAVLNDYGPLNEEYDQRLILLSLFSQYDDIRHLYLFYKNPQLLPASQSQIGWECSLQPFREPERCLQTLAHLEAYVAPAELTKYKRVFGKMVRQNA